MKYLAPFLVLFLASCLNKDAKENTQYKKEFSLSEKDYHQLLTAVEKGDTKTIQEFLDDGFNVNTRDHLGDSLLFYAITSGEKKSISQLLKAGANANIKRDGTPISFYAVPYYARGPDELEALSVLMENPNVDLDARARDEKTILHEAAATGIGEAIPIIVKAGADVNATDRYGNTPLHMAARSSGRNSTIAALISRCSEIDTTLA